MSASLVRCLQLARPGGHELARADYRKRGKGITPAGGDAEVPAVDTDCPVEAVVAAELKPDDGRRRLLSRRSRASTDAALRGHAVPGRMSQSSISGCRFASRSGRLVAASSGAVATRPQQEPALWPSAVVLPDSDAEAARSCRRGRRPLLHSAGPRSCVRPGCELPHLLRCSSALENAAGRSLHQRLLVGSVILVRQESLTEGA